MIAPGTSWAHPFICTDLHVKPRMYFGRLWTADKMPCDMRPNICKMHQPLNWSSTSSCQATRRAVRTAPYGYPLCHCFWYLSTAFLHSPEHSCSCAAQEQTCGHLPTHEPAGLLATSLPPLPGLGTWWHMELSEHFVIRPLGSFPLAVKKKDRSACSSSPVLSEQLQKCLEVCPGLCEPCMRGSVRFYSSCCSSHMAPSPPRGSRAGFSLVFNMQAFTVLHFALPPPSLCRLHSGRARRELLQPHCPHRPPPSPPIPTPREAVGHPHCTAGNNCSVGCEAHCWLCEAITEYLNPGEKLIAAQPAYRHQRENYTDSWVRPFLINICPSSTEMLRAMFSQ